MDAILTYRTRKGIFELHGRIGSYWFFFAESKGKETWKDWKYEESGHNPATLDSIHTCDLDELCEYLPKYLKMKCLPPGIVWKEF